MHNITFLDCTLRDGGYYNDWNFNLPLSEKIIDALNSSDVDIVEVGYKSKKNDKFYGLFRYCNENYLHFLKKYSNCEYAFMIDVKEFIINDSINYDALNEIILPVDKSVFSWVRLASHFSTIDKIEELSNYFKEKNYKVAINLMGVSLLKDEDLIKGLQTIEKCQSDVFYLADSFGSFYPEDIKKLIRFCKKYYSGVLGFHAHDNQGLAFYNAIAAIEEGVKFIDATILGMGRGAGNLKTEQFLLGKSKFLNEESPSRFGKLLDVIESDIKPLKEKYDWGYNYSYMISGLNNIHQAYCQELQDLKRFSVDEIGEILRSIPSKNKTSFNAKILEETIINYLNGNQIRESFEIPVFRKELITKNQILIVAGGKTSKEYKNEYHQLIKEKSLQVIEINNTGTLEEFCDRITILLNNYKLEKYLRNKEDFSHNIITGQKTVSTNVTNNKSLFSIEYKIDEPSLEKTTISIPDYDAGIYGIMLALMLEPKNIYLVGFDGTKNLEHKNVMNTFFAWMYNYANKNNIDISSITPTNYMNLKVKSIYSL